MADIETGFRWWMRYVLVPLIGTGGAIALLAAWINKPVQQPQSGAPLESPTLRASASTVQPSQAERARTAAARWLQAIADNDIDTIVEMSGEPIHLLGKTFLTKAALRSDLAAETNKPSKVSVKEIFVTQLNGEYTKLLPFSEPGDYIALIPGPFTPPLESWLALHLRPRGEGFVVLRLREAKFNGIVPK